MLCSRSDRLGACRGLWSCPGVVGWFWGFSELAAGVLLPLASLLGGCTREMVSNLVDLMHSSSLGAFRWL